MTVLVTGLNDDINDEQIKIETIKENGDATVCPQMINYPLNVYDAAGASFPDKTIVVCGGYGNEGYGNGYKSECYRLKNSLWEPFGQLQTARSGHAATTIGDSIWFTGGDHLNDLEIGDSELATTEILRYDGTMIPGPDLPEARDKHCQTTFGNTILIIGKS